MDQLKRREVLKALMSINYDAQCLIKHGDLVFNTEGKNIHALEEPIIVLNCLCESLLEDVAKVHESIKSLKEI